MKKVRYMLVCILLLGISASVVSFKASKNPNLCLFTIDTVHGVCAGLARVIVPGNFSVIQGTVLQVPVNQPCIGQVVGTADCYHDIHFDYE